MALPFTTTTISTYSTPSICHIFKFPNKSQISLARNRTRGSCKATINGNHDHDYDEKNCIVKLDRRNILLGLGGLVLTSPSTSFGAANAAEMSKKKVVVVEESSEFPITLGSVTSVIVPRPKRSRSKKEKEEEEEVLVIEGIEFVADKALKFDVHVNDDEDSLSRPDKAEFAGSLVYLPQYNKKVKTNLNLGITDLLEDLGADNDTSIKVTLVPRFVQRTVTIRGIKIDYFSA